MVVHSRVRNPRLPSCSIDAYVLELTWRFMGSYKWGYKYRVTIHMTHTSGLIL